MLRVDDVTYAGQLNAPGKLEDVLRALDAIMADAPAGKAQPGQPCHPDPFAAGR